MAIEFKLPELGENISEGDVISVMVAAGDTITVDQPILEMETGKATVEVPSDRAGTIIEVRVREGDKAQVGQVVLILDAEDASPDAPPAPPEAVEAPAPVTEPVEAPAPPAEGAAVLAPPPMPPPVTAPDLPPPLPTGVPVAAAPSVRKFARELGVDITQVKGNGPGGRIGIDDVKSYTKRVVQAGGQASAHAIGALPLPDFARWGEVEVTRMSAIRKATAEHMARCWASIPHVTQNDQVDITRFESLRKQWKYKAEQAGGKLTPTAILLKIVAGALKAHPQFNASIDIGNSEIIRKKYIHIGVAVDTPKGLMVPVLRDVDQKNIVELAAELTEIAGRAREGKLGLDEMQGGSFTITNLGGIGGSHFTPIVNHPEVAILGVGRAATAPTWLDGEFVPRLMMPLSLSYDHRVIDGADGARFIRWICDAIEEPLLLAMEG